MTQDKLNQLPLFITAAALWRAENRNTDILSFSGPEIVNALVNRELKRLRNTSRDLGADKQVLPRLLALATMTGGFRWKAVEEAKDNAFAGLGIPEKWAVREKMRQSGWVRDNILQPVTPDIVGAGLVAQVLEREQNDETGLDVELAKLAVLGQLAQKNFSTLCRVEHDAGGDLGKTTTPLAILEDAVENSLGSNILCQELMVINFGEYGHQIAHLATLVGQRIDASQLPPEQEAELLNNLSVHLSNYGDHHGALEAIQRAVSLYKKLATQNPAQFNPDLAQSLNNLSNRLSATGNHEDALKAIQRAVAIREELAAQNPARFNPDLAMSYGAFGIILRGIGNLSEAMEKFQAGAELVRPFAEQYPNSPSDRTYQALLRDLKETRKLMASQADEDAAS